jgi:hypothetical protein
MNNLLVFLLPQTANRLANSSLTRFISPGLTTGIVLLHPVKHHRAFQRRLVAVLNILVFSPELEQPPAYQSQLGFSQLGQFVDDFRRAHDWKIVPLKGLVRSKLCVGELKMGCVADPRTISSTPLGLHFCLFRPPNVATECRGNVGLRDDAPLGQAKPRASLPTDDGSNAVLLASNSLFVFLLLHAVKHHRAFQRRLIAELNTLANGSFLAP